MGAEKKTAWFAFILLFGVTACGYRFVGGGSFPSGITSVFVEVFINQTDVVGLENLFTNDLIYEITRRRDVQIESKDTAEGNLSGVITTITFAPAARREETVAVERRVSASLDLKLTEANGTVVWSAKGVSANQVYSVGITNQETETSKQEALAALSKRFAEVIYNQLTSDF